MPKCAHIVTNCHKLFSPIESKHSITDITSQSFLQEINDARCKVVQHLSLYNILRIVLYKMHLPLKRLVKEAVADVPNQEYLVVPNKICEDVW